jgi:hypothetical protein
MLDTLDICADRFNRSVPPALNTTTAAQNFAAAIAAMMAKMEPDVSPPATYSGAPIFSFNQPIFVQQLITLKPTRGVEWAEKISAAWQAACAASTITPGTVVDNGTWSQSGVDSLTATSGAATITTLAVATALLKARLLDSSSDLNDASVSQRIFVSAFREATLMFQLTLIGLAAGSPPTPVPVIVGVK